MYDEVPFYAEKSKRITEVLGEMYHLDNVIKCLEDDYIVLDTETTGLHPYDTPADEMLELAIVNKSGETLFHDFFKPTHRKRWDEAQRIHGITPEFLADKMTFRHHRETVKSIIENAPFIVGYNVEFDLGFLNSQGVEESVGCFDLMEAFAVIYGDYSDYHNSYTWKKLIVCARYYGYDWAETTAHGALADTLASLHCAKSMLRELKKYV